MANTLNYIGVDLSSPNKKFESWLKENQIIINDLRKYGPILDAVEASFLALLMECFFGIILINFVVHAVFKTFQQREVLL